MINPNFTIRLSPGKLGLLYGCGIFFILLLVASVFLLHLKGGMQFLCYSSVVLILAVLVTSTIARYDVEGSVIKVRTGFGRVYQVSCEEIESIICNETHSSRHGTRYAITVATKQTYFSVGNRLLGFSEFAEYLLVKLDNGEIKESAVSEECRKELQRYQQGIWSQKKS